MSLRLMDKFTKELCICGHSEIAHRKSKNGRKCSVSGCDCQRYKAAKNDTN